MSSSPTEARDRRNGGSRAGAAAAVDVVMPQMGVSVAEGTVGAWLKQPGEAIAADEPICEVTTDKIDIEIPAPGAGTVAELLVEEGATVAVGTVLARIETASPRSPGDDGPRAEGAAPSPPTAQAAPGAEEHDRSRFYSPVVRRIAERHGVDLEAVSGAGIGGRVRKVDLLRWIESHPAGADAEAPQRPLHSESPYREDDAGAAAPVATDLEGLLGPSRREPMGAMRKAIAEHMVASRRTAAHCTTVVEADFGSVAAERGRLKEPMSRRGANLTYLAFVACAVVESLGEHPRLNASVEGDEIVLHEDVNLGIAVALEQGLIVPVIRQAQRLSLEGMAAAIGDVADRARSGRLDPDDLAGGTFTITNPGQFGAVIATPIINQPQVAILDLEAVTRRVVAVDGPDGSESIAIRPMAYLCMSWDHRALDGADAARFLGSVRARIESWRAAS
jgi:2-oxoglutarate dehydrogenase E2 component (dihydrolipoamide succinyltransferase)